MEKKTQNKKLLRALNNQLKKLESDLVEAKKREGKDLNIEVKVKKTQARFERVKKKGAEDKALGKFFLEIHILAKQEEVFIPLSVASGKKVAGFMYQIEGTGTGTIASTEIKVLGEGIKQVTVGTLVYAKIPKGKIASFKIQAVIRGKFGKEYQLAFTRLNYKLSVTDVRYEQYLKTMTTGKVKLS
jgi:hypothetical protein